MKRYIVFTLYAEDTPPKIEKLTAEEIKERNIEGMAIVDGELLKGFENKRLPREFN